MDSRRECEDGDFYRMSSSKVPDNLMSFDNSVLFRPYLVSIGPNFHGRTETPIIEEHKGLYLKDIINRTGKDGIEIWKAFASKKAAIQRCYQDVDIERREELLKMMVLDAGFMLELFRKVVCNEAKPGDKDDPISRNLRGIARDLLILGNQIPFFVLKILVDPPISALGEEGPCLLNMLALNFFSRALGFRYFPITRRNEEFKPRHILDLFRLSLIPPSPSPSPSPSPCWASGSWDSSSIDTSSIPSAEKLHGSCIRFKRKEHGFFSFLDIKFRNGVLEIPPLVLDTFSRCLLLNCVAFEEELCHPHVSAGVTAYVNLMKCLIRTPEDEAFLQDRNIVRYIEYSLRRGNYYVQCKAVYRFFCEMNISKPTHPTYLDDLFSSVNHYIGKGWNVLCCLLPICQLFFSNMRSSS